MALPSSGSISLGQVNTELGVSATATRSLGDTTTRNLFGVASGAISMSNGYGKANQFAFTISSNQTNANLATLATNAGWNGSSKVVATIGSGVYISSNSTGTPALTVNGSFAGGVELVNNGYIVGRGGNGGNANSGSGSAGGTALSVLTAISITNNGTVAGGGGGGGAGGWGRITDGYQNYRYANGGGGGGGRSSAAANSSGGTGGGTGGAGTVSAAGSGGAGAQVSNYGGGGYARGGNGGSGGGWGSNGSGGATGIMVGGIGGGSGGGGGGASGAAVSGNSNITWVTLGTRLGSIA